MPPSSDFLLGLSEEGTSYFVLFPWIFVQFTSFLISRVPSHVPSLEVINMSWKDAGCTIPGKSVQGNVLELAHARSQREETVSTQCVHTCQKQSRWVEKSTSSKMKYLNLIFLIFRLQVEAETFQHSGDSFRLNDWFQFYYQIKTNEWS